MQEDCRTWGATMTPATRDPHGCRIVSTSAHRRHEPLELGEERLLVTSDIENTDGAIGGSGSQSPSVVIELGVVLGGS